MRVNELMARKVVRCHLDDNLQTAAGKMWEHDVGVLPVVDDQDRVVGMITDRDIAMAAYLNACPLNGRKVRETVSGRVYCVHPDDPLARAEEVMSKWQVRRLPVVDEEGRLSGVISLTDLARTARADALGSKSTAWEVTHTLQAIGEKRTALEIVAGLA